MRNTLHRLLAVALLAALPAVAGTLTRNPNPPKSSVGGKAPMAIGPTSITQSTSLTPVVGSVACNSNGITSDNNYWRAFTLSSFPALDSTFFVVESVDIAIEEATAGSGTTQPIVVRLYKNNGAPFPGGTQELVSTTNVDVANQALTLLNIPIVPSVAFANAADVLVLEVAVPDSMGGAGHRFFIGSNASGQSAPGYIITMGCGIFVPTDIAAIGFPNMHLIMRVNGQNQTTPVELQRLTIE